MLFKKPMEPSLISFFVNKNITHSLCYYDHYNTIKLSVSNSEHNWLVDTGASLSAVKYDTLQQHNIPFQIGHVKINGVCGELCSIGFVDLRLSFMNEYFIHRFHVFKDLCCASDGILGLDFLKKYKGKLNLELDTLKLTKNNREFCLDLQPSSSRKKYISLSPRCESVHFVPTRLNEDCVVLPTELCEGVFLASCIVRPVNGKIPIRILNTREEEISLSFFSQEVDKLSDYSILCFDKPPVNADRVKKLFNELKLDYLNSEEQLEIEKICAKFSDIFHLEGDKLSTCNIYEQSIVLKPNTVPVYKKQYRLPKSQKGEIQKQIKKMLEDDIIEETMSEWSSPILLVPKKCDTDEKKYRLVVDYRKLNENIADDRFPLPNIVDILDSLSGAMYFSHLDLQTGYFQFNLETNSRKCTAFTFDKQYQMKRMPMGLKTSPSAFSRAMTVALSGLNYDKCLIYMDDLICIGRGLSSHNKNLIDIFTRLRQVNLKLNPSKCQFLKKDLLYLGHIVSAQGLKPDPEKTRVINNYPTPKCSDDVRRFVAFSNYYRRFIPKFAEIVIPLNKLLRKNTDFIWTDECEKSFQFLKRSLASPPILQYPDFSTDNEFKLYTDASGIAIGSMLCNKDGRPVAYASRSLNKAELNYPTIEKEMLAIVWSVKYFRPYLFGKRFKIYSDHRPLVYLFNMNNPSSRLTKFRLILEEYDFVIEYVKGTNNVAADALSRVTITSTELKEMNEHILNVMTRKQTKKMRNEKEIQAKVSGTNGSTNSWSDQPKVVEMLRKPINSVELLVISRKKMSSMKDTNCSDIFILNEKENILYTCPELRSYTARDAYVSELEQYCNKINIKELYIIKLASNEEFINILSKEINKRKSWSGPRINILKGIRRIISNDDKKVVMNDYHILPTSGHAGIRRMINNIKKSYFWPGLERDVTNFVNKCKKCQMQKHSLPIKEPMVVTSTAMGAFDKVYLDIVGPLDKDYYGKVYILTIQCELTKFVEAYSLERKDAVSVAKSFVENFILRYGVPREIATDKGSEFIASTMREVCKLLHVTQLFSTAYHHESIGALENTHKNLNSYLRIQTNNNSREWSTWIPYWCFAYNTTVHTSTKFTPYELVFGKYCKLPSNLTQLVEPLYNSDDYPLTLKYRLQKSQQQAREHLLLSKNIRKCNYDKYVNPIMYKCNDMILLKNENCNKFQNVYNGPFRVIEDISPNVRILKDNKIETVHKNRTKLFRE